MTSTLGAPAQRAQKYSTLSNWVVGGWNESKFGAGDSTGRGSIEFWTRAKKTTTRWSGA